MNDNASLTKATFAAGCFWGVETLFRQVEGVTDVVVGYTGGQTTDPTYKDVCGGRTGHAEAVEVTFDPARVSYDRLLDAFWAGHDPTTLNRQGPDRGEQYRSGVFYRDEAQHAEAERPRSGGIRAADSGDRSSPRLRRPRSSTAPRSITSDTTRSTASQGATSRDRQ